MSYVDSATHRADPRSIAAVAVIHAAAGLALVTGLTVTGAMDPPTPPLKGESITVPLPPPPPPEPTIDEQVEPRTSTITYAPNPPLPLPTSSPNIPTSEVVPDAGPIDLVPTGTPSAATGDGEGVLPKATPSPSPLPTFAATKPVPRTSPGTWITDADYRSRWVNEGLTGTARFRLDIGTDGRVTDCRVTRSTGHAALDTATCSLVQRRARFAPAKDSSGRATAGVYGSAIVWRLPE